MFGDDDNTFFKSNCFFIVLKLRQQHFSKMYEDVLKH